MSASVLLLPSQVFLSNLGILSVTVAQETKAKEKNNIIIIFFIYKFISILVN